MRYGYLNSLGLMVLIPIPLAMGSILLALLYGERRALLVFLALTAIHAAVGWVLLRLIPASAEFSRLKALLVPILGFLSLILTGALPYIWLSSLDPLSAILEATSGYTTCGATVFGHGGFQVLESLPRSLIFWRSATEWMGGIVLWAILGLLGSKAAKDLARVWGRKRLDIDVRTLGRQILVTYIALTLVSALLLCILGSMSPFDALNHAMTSLSTGGFSTRNAGLAFYNQGGYHFSAILIVVSLTSLAGMSSFVWLSGLLIRGQIKNLFRGRGYGVDRRDFALMFSLLSFMAMLLFYHYWWQRGFTPSEAFKQGVFYSITTFSGTGFNITDLSEWNGFTALVLMVGGVVGGSGYSSSGGLSLEAVRRAWSALMSFFQEGKGLTSEEGEALLLTLVTLGLNVLGAILLLPVYGDKPAYVVFYQVAALQANTGPQLLDLATPPPSAKLLYAFLMLGGFFKHSLSLLAAERLLSTTK